jgi:molybdenum cofactor cytidylyltransferase
VGAPGCARSRKVNIVDWILPRLLAGDRLTRRDIVGLGHGGLLQDVPERGMPREVRKEEAETETTVSMISSSE